MGSQSTDLHFVFLPLMAQGHLIPSIDIARILALRGATVTIITTPVNADRFRSVITRAAEAKLKMQVVELPLSLDKVGLPDGCESFDMLATTDLGSKLLAAMDMLEEPVENVIRELRPAPSCIFSDSLFHWSTDLARRFNVPRIVFHGQACYWILCMQIFFSTDVLDGVKSDTERFVLPGLPHRIELTKLQALGWEHSATPEAKESHQRILDAEFASYGVVVNSFEELEPEYVKALAEAKGTKVWCIGPVSLCHESSNHSFERGNKAAIDKHECLKWLDAKDPSSVIYASLGSLACTCTKQAIELALGLESTNRPFIWCIPNITEELETWLSEDGIEERVKGRGLIVHGWAPQILILSHPSVGGFLTHGGWNSTLEGVSAGLPMVTWPHFDDQFINQHFIVEVWKIGVRIGTVDVPVLFGKEDKIDVLVTREDVKTAVECLMDEGKEGKARRERAKAMAETAKRATEEGGSSLRNLSSMIQDIMMFK